MAHDTRHVHIISPAVKPEDLQLQRVRGFEEIGRPSLFELELLSPDPHLKIDDLLGDKATIALALPDGDRYFNGHITRFGQAGIVGRYTRYHAELRPFFWLLSRASDSRIYKQMTVPDIVKEVVAQFGLGLLEDKLHGSYTPREYTVQYRETYFDFLSRLMEEEGIYYYFSHTKSAHQMVLCDDRGSHSPVPNYEKIPFIDPEENANPREEHFSEWRHVQEFCTGAFAVNDFDFEVPRADLVAVLSRPLKHQHASFEQYDPVAGFVDAMDAGGGGDPHRAERGELYARLRLEEAQASNDRGIARGNARGPHAGALFELTGHPRDSLNRELLVVRAEYHMFQPGFDAGSSSGKETKKDGDDGKEEPLYDIQIVAQPSKVPFRPVRVTPRATISGPHTAIVVGSGEISTDKFGRVKVHFPWDRKDTDGCWLRVSQAWAGAGWGSQHVPRVGHEVIVEFIEGDPDRPIVTGRVYNGANASPFGLPDGATKSGILSRSSKGGSADNANEIRLEDKLGDEQLFLHAEKNMDTEVEHDQTLWVGNDRHKKVDNDQTEDIKGNKTIHVVKNHKEAIDQNMSLEVGENEDETIGGNRSITVKGDHTEEIKGNQGVGVSKNASWNVGGNGAMSFGAQGSFDVGKSLAQSVGKDFTCSVTDNASVSTGKSHSLSVGKSSAMDVGEALAITVKKDWTSTVDGANKTTIKKEYGLEAKEILLEGKDEIVLKCGSAQITLKKNGDITIKGNKISIKGDGDVVVKGSKIAQN
jgi:type VI secretion system secreted protein VgrG